MHNGACRHLEWQQRRNLALEAEDLETAAACIDHISATPTETLSGLCVQACMLMELLDIRHMDPDSQVARVLTSMHLTLVTAVEQAGPVISTICRLTP